jgi:Domain of unknown function (DUF4437)
MKRILASALALVALLVAGSQALGQEKTSTSKPKAAAKPTHVMENESDLKWMDAPPVFPPGAKMAVLQGDPNKPGLYTVRLRVGDGYKVAPHWHPAAENLTIISGTFNLGTGDEADQTKTTALSAGAFATMPARMHHYAWTKGETEVQVHGNGPFKLFYVNPKDDPTHAAKK